MSKKKIVILNGARSADKHLSPILALLTDLLKTNIAAQVQIFSFSDITINQCIGCFHCWVNTPGQCIHTADAGESILQAVLDSDILVLFTPVIFGGYSAELKRILDRFLPMALPFLQKMHGEVHHPRRYAAFPHIIGIGISQAPNDEITRCFRTLVGRNAVNASTSYSAGVFYHAESPDRLRQGFLELFSTTEDLPGRDELEALMARINLNPPAKISLGKRRALLIIGSPKRKMPSTSAVLGEQLLRQLDKHGWQTSSLLLREDLLTPQGQQRLLCHVDEAETVIAAFPLYLDALPSGMTKAFELISSHREIAREKQPKNFLAIVNNGLPEAYQNGVALAICRFFALQCDMTWAGGLAFGAGEQLISGNPLTGFRGFRGTMRPPLYYVVRALNMAAHSLSKGHAIPEKAAQILSNKPVPLISWALWHWFLMRKGNKLLKNEARKNGLDIRSMYQQPISRDNES